jgi:hypothetical protein
VGGEEPLAQGLGPALPPRQEQPGLQVAEQGAGLAVAPQAGAQAAAGLGRRLLQNHAHQLELLGRPPDEVALIGALAAEHNNP